MKTGLLFILLLVTHKAHALYGKGIEPASESFVVALSLEGSPKDFQNFCSGVLISPTKVLTAGHCINGMGHRAYKMSMGLVYRPEVLMIKAGKEQIPASSVTYSPDYFESSSFSGEDLALIELSRPVKGIKPITMNTSPLYPGQEVSLIARGVKVSTRLHSVKRYHNAIVLFLGPDAGACLGDSGGAVIVNQKTGEPRLAGIIMYSGQQDCERKKGYAYFPKAQF